MKNNGKRGLALLLSLLIIMQSCFVSPKLTRNIFAENVIDGVNEEPSGEDAPAEEAAPAEETNSAEETTPAEEAAPA
ncbi:MAG: hypothetical protein IKZ63_04470, partial [Oscillospiraceae bacterium]|nr:hypothetical protein [Oscillospiraceae bacterium]